MLYEEIKCMVRLSLAITDKFQEYCVRIVGCLPASDILHSVYTRSNIPAS